MKILKKIHSFRVSVWIWSNYLFFNSTARIWHFGIHCKAEPFCRQNFEQSPVQESFGKNLKLASKNMCVLNRAKRYIPFDSLQRSATRIFDDFSLTGGLDLQRRDFGSVCMFYRLFHGKGSEQLFDFWLSTVHFQRSFSSRTCKPWNERPAMVFHEPYDIFFLKQGF